MFYGQYNHNIDKKGRMFVPAKFREELGEKFILCKGIEGKECLCVYPLDEWNKLDEKIKTLPTIQAGKVIRFLYAGATELECDAQGRMLVPQILRDFASLEGDTAIIGMSTHLEIWNGERYEQETKESTPESIAELLGDLNF